MFDFLEKTIDEMFDDLKAERDRLTPQQQTFITNIEATGLKPMHGHWVVNTWRQQFPHLVRQAPARKDVS